MKYNIATLDAWKAFALLCSVFLLMVLLIPFYGLGFVVAGLAVFAWLHSIAFELSKVNSVQSSKFTVFSLVGAAASVLLVIVPTGYLGAGIVLRCILGCALLGSMLFLMYAVGSLLARAEKDSPPKINAAWLVYAWPIGVWYLQPRLKSVLSR